MRGFSCTQLPQFFQYGRRGYGALWPYGVVFLIWDDASFLGNALKIALFYVII